MTKRPQPCLVLAGLALALLGCRSDGPRAKPEQELAMYREFALRYYDEGDLLRAEDQVDKGLELAPRDDQLRLMKGWIRQRRGSPEDIFVAEQVFRELAPGKDYRALLGLGQALERKGVIYWEAAEAVASGERATSSDDPAARVQDLRRKARAAWKESVLFFERSLEEKPGELQAVNGLQRVHALAGDLDASLAWAQELLEQSGAEVAFWRTKLERPDLSAGEERRLRSLLEGSRALQSRTHLQASILELQKGRAAEALAHIDAALAIDPEAPEVHSRRAQLLHTLGRPAEAIASLETYLRLSREGFDHPDVARALDLLSTWKDAEELEAQSARRP